MVVVIAVLSYFFAYWRFVSTDGDSDKDETAGDSETESEQGQAKTSGSSVAATACGLYKYWVAQHQYPVRILALLATDLVPVFLVSDHVKESK